MCVRAYVCVCVCVRDRMIAMAIAHTASVIEAFLKRLSYVMVLRRMSCILCDEKKKTKM